MKLTDNEIRDITRHLEASKPLPDKYRFLPFQTIEQVDEPRSEAELKLQSDMFDLQTERQIKGWNNKLIWGDNKLILSSIEIKPHVKQNSLAVELADFSVFYSQDAQNIDVNLKNGKSKVIVDRGQVIKISKDKDGTVSREVLTKHWIDWIDYWAVDFDFESKREIIRVPNEDSGKIEEQWSGDYIFENEWQSFRTKKDRALELTSAPQECRPGPRKIAVKVVDIFGNDTMKVVDVRL